MNKEIIFKADNLKKYFFMEKHCIKALDDISFHVHKGEIMGIVGESGCGKSTLARSIMGINALTAGKVYYKEINISDKKIYNKNAKYIQKNIQMIFQDSDGSLNPRMTVEESIIEPLLLLHICNSKEEALKIMTSLLEQVGINMRYRKYYPAELSGGQRQRISIARCLGTKPQLIIADEPVASLDVLIQAQIINLLQDIQAEAGFSMMFIAHDLSMVRYLCDTVCVMKKGKIVEYGPTEEIFVQPAHEYTRLLLSSILLPDPAAERKKKAVNFNDRLFTMTGQQQLIGENHWVLV